MADALDRMVHSSRSLDQTLEIVRYSDLLKLLEATHQENF